MLRDDFLKYQAKTTPYPMGMEVKRAKGSYIIDQKGKKHLDFVAGVSACSIGHRHHRGSCHEETAQPLYACHGLWRICTNACSRTL